VGSNKAIRGQVETVQQKQVKEAEGRAATVRPNGQPPEGGLNREQAQETMDQLQESLQAFLSRRVGDQYQGYFLSTETCVPYTITQGGSRRSQYGVATS
jgi:hypothetical protein